jgi:hypothetical protein
MKRILLGLLASFLVITPALGYTIQKGDTLSALAKRFNTSVSNLAVQNGIQNPNKITVGQEIETESVLGSTKYVQAQYFTLAGSGATLGATTITLKSFKQIDGSLLTMSNFGSKGFGTIEPNSGIYEEQISFTGVTQNTNGTATLSGVSTVGNVYPYTEVSGLSITHAGGVKFVISNTVGFYNTFTNKFNDEIVSSTWTFATNTIYFSKNNRGSKFYDDGVHLGWSDDGVNTFTFAGGSSGLTAGKGIIINSSAISVNTAPSSTGALGYYGSQIGVVTSTGLIVDNIGLSVNTSSSLMWTASTTFSGSTTTISKLTINGNNGIINNVQVQFPAAQGASSTILTNNGLGGWFWNYPDWQLLISTTTAISTNTINASNLPSRKNYRVLITATGLTDAIQLNFNQDLGNNYNYRVNDFGGAQQAASSQSFLRLMQATVSVSSTVQMSIDIANETAIVKPITLTGNIFSASSPGMFILGVGSWNNTASQINYISVKAGSSGTFSAGTRVQIYGSQD